MTGGGRRGGRSRGRGGGRGGGNGNGQHVPGQPNPVEFYLFASEHFDMTGGLTVDWHTPGRVGGQDSCNKQLRTAILHANSSAGWLSHLVLHARAVLRCSWLTVLAVGSLAIVLFIIISRTMEAAPAQTRFALHCIPQSPTCCLLAFLQVAQPLSSPPASQTRAHAWPW